MVRPCSPKTFGWGDPTEIPTIRTQLIHSEWSPQARFCAELHGSPLSPPTTPGSGCPPLLLQMRKSQFPQETRSSLKARTVLAARAWTGEEVTGWEAVGGLHALFPKSPSSADGSESWQRGRPFSGPQLTRLAYQAQCRDTRVQLCRPSST